MIGFDELQHDYKNPVDQCNNLNPLVLPEYAAHALILILMMSSGEATSAILNIPLLRDLHYRIKESLLVYLVLKTDRLIFKKERKLNFKEFFFHHFGITCLRTADRAPGRYDSNMLIPKKLVYHIWRYSKRPRGMSKPGLYDPTTIMNRDSLNFAMYEGWSKMAFYFLSFFYYLYSMIYVLITY